MLRRILLTLVLPGVILFAGVAPAAADPVGTPAASPTFTITCQQTTFHVVGTGAAGHVLENNSIAILFGADVTVRVDGAVVDQFTFRSAANAEGLPLSTCSGFTEFQDEQGQTVRIEFTNAQILLTPPRQ
jgi:hypothetical protein